MSEFGLGVLAGVVGLAVVLVVAALGCVWWLSSDEVTEDGEGWGV